MANSPRGRVPLSHGTMVGLREGTGSRHLSECFMQSRARGRAHVRAGGDQPALKPHLGPRWGAVLLQLANAAASGLHQCRGAGSSRQAPHRQQRASSPPEGRPGGSMWISDGKAATGRSKLKIETLSTFMGTRKCVLCRWSCSHQN